MNAFRSSLPQVEGKFFLTDGGIETTLIFLESLELPHFSAIDALRSPEGSAALWCYFQAYVTLAERFGTGLVLETATWRASSDWGQKLDYRPGELRRLNERAVRMLEDLRAGAHTAAERIVISGCIGPRGDGYSPGAVMTERESDAYHSEQVQRYAFRARPRRDSAVVAARTWAAGERVEQESRGTERFARARHRGPEGVRPAVCCAQAPAPADQRNGWLLRNGLPPRRADCVGVRTALLTHFSATLDLQGWCGVSMA